MNWILQDEREAARLQCLRRMQVLDTAAEESFDSITRSVARHFDVPIALVSLVDENRQWFKSKVGLDVCETERRNSFCKHALPLEHMLIVEDARLDERFANNPLVTGPPFIRFYAGTAIRITPDQLPIGTLCVIDIEPRTFDESEQADLRKMSRLVTRQFEISSRRLATNAPRLGLRSGGAA